MSLGIETPVLTTAICSSAEVIDEVGDDATGWYFIGAQTERSGTPAAEDYQAILDTLGYTNSTELGLGNLGLTGLLTLASIADGMADEGADITGASIYETLGTSDGLGQLARRQPLGVWLGGVDPDHLRLHVPGRHVCVRRRNPDRSGLRGVRHHAVPAVMFGRPSDTMTDYLFFVLLGTGAAAIIAAFGLGLVVTYQGSGVVNFAFGAMATGPGYVYADLRQGSYPFPVPVSRTATTSATTSGSGGHSDWRC